MMIRVLENKSSLSAAAAGQAAANLQRAIRERGRARVVVATGTSQLDFLNALTQAADIDWQRVEMFHLDEYVGLPMAHPASFRRYLLENFIRKTGITHYHLLDGEGDVRETIRNIGEKLVSARIDIAFAGIGENGHLAFNDPPADFETNDPYLVVNLDAACRHQQVGEGWFADISEVPRQAITMSIRQILGAHEIIAVVPDVRKAAAVKLCVEGEIAPVAPASILRTHAAATLYLDKESSSQLNPATLVALAATG